jgi:hypothetical protein
MERQLFVLSLLLDPVCCAKLKSEQMAWCAGLSANLDRNVSTSTMILFVFFMRALLPDVLKVATLCF